MTREEAIRELEMISKIYPQTPEECLRVGEAIDMAQKALKDKKARYWKRRWLKMRENIYTVIEMFEQSNKPASATLVRIICLGGNHGLDTDIEARS